MTPSWTRTKIVATLGPATEDKKTLLRLIQHGADVMRLNFAHGTHEEHQKRIETVRQVAHQQWTPIGILLDLPGPKLRVGAFSEDHVEVKPDEEVYLKIQKQTKGKNVRLRRAGALRKIIPVAYPHLTKDVKKGHAVFIADGTIRLQVQSVKKDTVVCRVLNGGSIRPRNGINLPNSSLTLSPFTAADQAHLAFGLKHKVDFIGVSFVEKGSDIKRVRRFAEKRGANPFIIAKIEREQALKNLSSIMHEADGIMVARGDLGVEVPFSEIPGLQKEIIDKAHFFGKPVIVATQVLESMIESPRPTRAEATDISNAIHQGADAIMLSGETSVGKNPVEAVKALTQVIQSTEKRLRSFELDLPIPVKTLSHILCQEACHLADRVGARGIIVPSLTGATPARLSRCRPHAPVLALVKDRSLRRRLSLYWGMKSLPYLGSLNYEGKSAPIRSYLLKNKIAHRGEKYLIVSGAPGVPMGETGLIQVLDI